jgi:hypothetical protein
VQSLPWFVAVWLLHVGRQPPRPSSLYRHITLPLSMRLSRTISNNNVPFCKYHTACSDRRVSRRRVRNCSSGGQGRGGLACWLWRRERDRGHLSLPVLQPKAKVQLAVLQRTKGLNGGSEALNVRRLMPVGIEGPDWELVVGLLVNTRTQINWVGSGVCDAQMALGSEIFAPFVLSGLCPTSHTTALCPTVPYPLFKPRDIRMATQILFLSRSAGVVASLHTWLPYLSALNTVTQEPP